ncbi:MULTISPECIES: hypothetical protein [Rheinheimera]|uniref:Uncharacterized protein n=1 Tax=Rheinheimera pacifica TaxID=173990 RepID=A0A1H6N9E8_9GAMM|nr:MULTISPECIES: hypothetical protein [Rheinheimera]KUM54591.1 hypothetical protein AR688_14930 [Rheinheimera sp. EpRS3]SEI06758.1 hypothetical protein SAMN05660691_03292 [Rheinheimera pacifica]
MNRLMLVGIVLVASFSLLAQQRTQQVQVESTISGNQEQPKTIYVLPWQSPVSVIRIPGEPLTQQAPALSPLDRQQFLRFIAVQQGNQAGAATPTVNPQKQ